MTLMLKHWKIIALIGVVLFVMTSPCPPFTLKCNTWGVLVFLKFYWAPDIVEFVLSRFSDFNIAIAYWKSAFCGTWTPSFCEFTQIFRKMSTPPGGDVSIYTDLDGTLWVKCDKCHTPFHLKCATEECKNCVRSKRFICTFFCCRQF